MKDKLAGGKRIDVVLCSFFPIGIPHTGHMIPHFYRFACGSALSEHVALLDVGLRIRPGSESGSPSGSFARNRLQSELARRIQIRSAPLTGLYILASSSIYTWFTYVLVMFCRMLLQDAGTFGLYRSRCTGLQARARNVSSKA